MAVADGDVIPEFLPPQDGVAGQVKGSAQRVRITGDAQLRLSGLVGNYIELIVVRLDPEFVCKRRLESVEPIAGGGAFVSTNRTTGRVTGQGLDIRRLLQVMSVAIREGQLVGVVHAVVQPEGRKVLA